MGRMAGGHHTIGQALGLNQPRSAQLTPHSRSGDLRPIQFYLLLIHLLGYSEIFPEVFQNRTDPSLIITD